MVIVLGTLAFFMAFGVIWTILYCLFMPKNRRERKPIVELYEWFEGIPERRRARRLQQELEEERVRLLIDKFDGWKAEGYRFTQEQTELVEQSRAALSARKRM